MTPAGWIVWYYGTRDTLGAPGLDFVDSTGYAYAKKCDGCDRTKRHLTTRGDWVCSNHRCGRAWPKVKRFIFKGEVQRTRVTDGFELRNARWMDVGNLLSRMLEDPEFRWDMRLYVATCFGYSVDPRRDSEGIVETPGLSATFLELWPDAPGPWGRSRLYERITRARNEWVSRLARAGVPVS